MQNLLDENDLSAIVTQLLFGASDSVTLKLRREFEFGISARDIANLVDQRLDCRCLIPLPGIQRNRDGVVDDQRSHRGLFVTTSRYPPGSREFAARQNQRLILATSKDVADWCKRIAT